MRGPSWPELRAMENMERDCWNCGDWTVPDRSVRVTSLPSSPAGRKSFTLSRNSWFCSSGCRASPVMPLARSTACPPDTGSPAGTCMLDRMDWRSDSWMAGLAAPAPPGAGAGTGTVAGVLEARSPPPDEAEEGGFCTSAGFLCLVLPEPAACLLRPLVPPPERREPRLDMLLPPPPRLPPNSCISCLWSMLLRRLWSSLSPRLLKSRLPGRPPLPPPPPPDLELPGGGGLLRKSLTFLHKSSSLSDLGSCIQKNIFLSLPLNLRTNTRPVVQAGTALNSTSSGIRMRSSSTVPLVLSFHWRCISWSSDWVTISIPFLLSGLTILVEALKVILPALNSTRDDLAALLPPEEEPNRGPPTAIIS